MLPGGREGVRISKNYYFIFPMNRRQTLLPLLNKFKQINKPLFLLNALENYRFSDDC